MLACAGDSHAGLSSASRAGLSSAGWYPCAARAAPHLVLLQPRDMLLHQAQLPVVQPLGAQRGQRRCEGARECPGHAGGSGVSHGVRRAGPRPVLPQPGTDTAPLSRFSRACCRASSCCCSTLACSSSRFKFSSSPVCTGARRQRAARAVGRCVVSSSAAAAAAQKAL